MPRRRIPDTSIPRRLDRRRPRGNTIDAQRRPRRRRGGQIEAIAARRVRVLELRMSGGSYRQIAKQMGVDAATVFSDVQTELAALRTVTVEHAEELRDLEAARCDEMTSGLWPKVRTGNPASVLAAIKVSERRARLLGLDAPTASRTELSGSMSIAADTRLNAMKEDLLRWLDIVELQTLAAASDKLFSDAMALVEARKNRMMLAVSPSPPVITSVEGARVPGVALDGSMARCAPVEHGDGRDASDPMGSGGDIARSADADGPLNQDHAHACTTPVRLPPRRRLPGGVNDVATGTPAEESTDIDVDDA